LQYFPKRASERKLEPILAAVKNQSIKLEEFLLMAVEFLVEFTYNEIRKKRRLAILEMKTACFEAAEHESDPAWFKEYIDLYFNSKYARAEYTFDDDEGNIIDASLYKRYYTEENTPKDKEDINWVDEFVGYTRIDPKAGEIDNIKHLRGACIRLMTNNQEAYVLKILNAYCLYMLEFKSQKYINEAFTLLSEGFQLMKEKENYSDNELKVIFENFVSNLLEHNTELGDFMKSFGLYFDFQSLFLSKY